MIYALLVTVVVQPIISAWLIHRFLNELRDSHAAALQANNEPDARRILTRKDEAKRAEKQLKLQQELVESGGLFPDPTRAKKKPVGI